MVYDGRTDRQTDGWTDGKSDIIEQVGVPPKKMTKSNKQVSLNGKIHGVFRTLSNTPMIEPFANTVNG